MHTEFTVPTRTGGTVRLRLRRPTAVELRAAAEAYELTLKAAGEQPRDETPFIELEEAKGKAHGAEQAYALDPCDSTSWALGDALEDLRRCEGAVLEALRLSPQAQAVRSHFLTLLSLCVSYADTGLPFYLCQSTFDLVMNGPTPEEAHAVFEALSSNDAFMSEVYGLSQEGLDYVAGSPPDAAFGPS